MKKVLVLLAALLIATPAMAATNVDIECSQVGETKVVRVDYTVTRTTEEPRLRAVALNISVSTGTIDAISNFRSGESTQADPGYGIFPANFGRYIVPATPDWGHADYTPAAEAGDKGAPTGIPSSAIVVELGSLYDPDLASTEAPLDTSVSGDPLFEITVSDDCIVTITKEDLYRKSLVMEDGNPPDTDNMGTGQTCVVSTDPYPDTCWSAVNCPGQTLGDATCDGNVNIMDILKVKQSWAKSFGEAGYNCCADFTRTCIVNIMDVLRLKQNWAASGLGGDLTQACPATCP